MRYAKIVDKKLELLKTEEQYLKPTARVEAQKEITKQVEAEQKYKPVKFAPLPKFNQETQAVFQTAPVDKGDYIEAGVTVVDLPPEKEPVFDEMVKPVIKK
jgi:hypothetical protein